METAGDNDFLLLDYEPRTAGAAGDSEQTSSTEDGLPAPPTSSTLTSTPMTPEPMGQSERATSDDEEQRNVRQKLSHPSSPRSSPPLEPPVSTTPYNNRSVLPGPSKQRVIVKDVAYTTYRAVLHYVELLPMSFTPARMLTQRILSLLFSSTLTPSNSLPFPLPSFPHHRLHRS